MMILNGMVGQNLKPGYCVVILITKGESDHAIHHVPHGEELTFPWLFPRGVNGLSVDRSKRYVCSEVF